MLLYVHVPFCRAKCRYCAFHSLAGPTAEDMASYLDTLEAELRLHAGHLRGRRVETIFFGGGTPTLVPVRSLTRLLDSIRREFSVAGNAEISLEANPESVPSADGVKELTRAGFNRVSLGVQSFNGESLKTLGRLHTVSDAVGAFLRLQDGGFKNIGLDLMWGLPGQRPRQWMDELQQAVELNPTHLSCYGLTLEPETPMGRDYIAQSAASVQAGTELALTENFPGAPKPLPGEADQSRMYVHGMEYLASQGYMQYEISNAARMGYACRHSQGYWQGEEYLGLGPGATSTLRGLRWTNSTDHTQWREDVAAGGLREAPERISRKIRLLEAIMLRLRTAKGLPYDVYSTLSGRDLLADHGPLLRLLAGQGLLSLRNRHARLTLTGMLVSNSIIEKLFERLDEIWPDEIWPDEIWPDDIGPDDIEPEDFESDGPRPAFGAMKHSGGTTE